MKRKIELSNEHIIEVEYSPEVAAVLKAILRKRQTTMHDEIFLTRLDVKVNPPLTDLELYDLQGELGKRGVGIIVGDAFDFTVVPDYEGKERANLIRKVIIKDEKIFSEFVKKYLLLGEDQKDVCLTFYSKDHTLIYKSPIDGKEHKVEELSGNGYLLIKHLISYGNDLVLPKMIDRILSKPRQGAIDNPKKRLQNTIDTIRKMFLPPLVNNDDIFDGKASIGIKLKYGAQLFSEQ